MNEPRFISLRWRVILPLYVIILVIATTGAYLLARQADGAASISPTNILQQSRRAINQQAGTLYESQRRTAQAVALVSGVPQAILGGGADDLLTTLVTRAQRSNLDDLILADADGRIVLGLRRAADGANYIRMTADIVGDLTDGFAQIDGETLLYTAAPVNRNGVEIGRVLVGQRLSWVLATLHTSVMADAALFAPNGRQLAATRTDIAELNPTMNAPHPLQFNGEDYEGLYFPLQYGPEVIGSVGLLLSDSVALRSGVGQQLGALMLAALAAVVVIAVFISLSWMTARIGRVTRTAEALARGERTVRTNMLPTDEVGRMGRALDQYADYVQERQDTLRASLRRQRRENERLMAVLEALPDGIIVQDLDGRVLVMNEPARDLLGSRRMLRSNPDLQELTAFVTDRLGPALAPGIYMLGEPQNIRLDERIINAQVAAVTTVTRQRIGTVIILRDVTEQVQVETAREYLLQQIEAEVQEPLRDLVHASRRPTSEVAREIRQHAGALQKMILEMRELSDTSLRKITEERQRPILLDTLVWAVANEWRQVAQAQNLNLHVLIEKPGLYVLAEERRLRWAIGNIIDNAIKYTPPGGDLTLEVRDDTTDERAHLRVRDNGVGIARDELPHVFNRFYRGRPKTKGGREIRVPGSGQGLTVAKQIFEAHGGSLTIKSKQWVGTAVYFTIPLTSPVSYELPPLAENLEGETVRIDTRQINAANEQSQK